MPATPSIPDLLVRAKAGDAEAVERLLASCRSYLLVLARAQVEGRLRGKVDASDIVQQTLLEAYRGLPRFEGATEGEWLAWLKRILAHNAADAARHFHGTDKRQAGREIAIDQLAASSSASVNLPAPVGTPSQHLASKERDLQVADALARLPDEYREVIFLRNVQRLPFDELARRLGKSRPAVQMLWMRAIKKLQSFVHDESVSG